MPKMIFVNLPVADLAAAERFYTAIGCEKNDRFSNEVAICMVWSEEIFFMLLTRDFYATFTPKPIADTHATSAALLCLSMDSRAAVDAICAAAAGAGGRTGFREVQDMGFMYADAFEDPDGHTFEPMWMDPKAAEEGPPDMV